MQHVGVDAYVRMFIWIVLMTDSKGPQRMPELRCCLCVFAGLVVWLQPPCLRPSNQRSSQRMLETVLLFMAFLFVG